MSLVVSVVDHGRLGLVLPRFEIWPGDARHRLQPAGGADPRHFRKSVFAMAWAISAMVSAVAGVVVAVVNGVSSGLSAYGIKVFPAVILGGLDWIGGAVVGGIIIGLLENIAQYVDSEYLHWGNLYEIAPFYVLIIILMIKPYGLFGTKDIERV